jgi:glutathione S-transferase
MGTSDILEPLAALVRDKTGKWLDELMAGRAYVAGKRFTIADITLYCALDFGAGVGQKIDPSLENLTAWFKRVDSRPSAAASLHPAAKQVRMKG